MNPTLVRIEDVADLNNLSDAFYLAARGLRSRPDVARFELNIDHELASLSTEILHNCVHVGSFHRFVVYDPKRRVIHAPVFRERVLHHALMLKLEPIFDRSLVDDTFACRIEKGSLAAVQRAQTHLRKYPWCVKIDMSKYFDSIEHGRLMEAVRRRVKGMAVLDLCERIVRAYSASPGHGLPIGALTSQNFANLYLSLFDRQLLASPRVLAMVRYMDDVVWWCGTRADAKASLAEARTFLRSTLDLTVKDTVQIHPSRRGLTFLGFRLMPHRLLLSRRRRRRYREARHRWERAWKTGCIGARDLQCGVSTALAITAHADSVTWRRVELERVPPVDA